MATAEKARKPTIDMTGRRFGRLVVLSRTSIRIQGSYSWLCRCDCGLDKIVHGPNLRSGHTISCGCALTEYRKQITLSIKEAAIRRAFQTYRGNAESRRPFELSEELFRLLVTAECFYCGHLPPIEGVKQAWGYSQSINGVDRVDNTRGYTPDNVVSCCQTCNDWKKARTLDDFLAQVERIHLRQGQK